jgi:hypothetical protein
MPVSLRNFCCFQPAEEAGHGDAVAPVGGAGAFLLGFVFLCFGQNAEVGGVDDFRLGQCGLDFGRGPIAVDLNDGFSKGLQRRLKFDRLLDDNGFPEMGLHIFRQFCLVDEEFGFASLFQNGVGQHDWSVGHIMAPDVKDPGDRVRLGEHGGVDPGFAQ